MSNSQLDFEQVLPLVLDETNKALQVNVVASSAVASSVKLEDGLSSNLAAIDGTGHLSIKADALPLPSGAATEASLATLAGTVSGGKVQVEATLDASDIEIGAIEIKNGADDTRAVVKTDGTNNALVVVQNVQPLPTGASTAANQSTGNSSLSSIDGKIVAVNTGAVVVASGSIAVNNASGGSAVNIQDGGNSITVDGSVTVSSTDLDIRDLTSVSDSVAAVQSGNWSVRAQDGSGNALTSSAAGSNRALHVEDIGYVNVEFVRNDYGSVNVTTSAYVQLIASTAAEYQEIQIFDSSGQTLKLAIGGAGVEVDKLVIPPGGTFPIKFRIASGSRVSIRAISATANSGEIDVQLLG